MPELEMLAKQACSGEELVNKEFEVLAGPLPVID
jgi:hypothetical protein